MDNWRKNRWTIYVFVTMVYIVVKALTTILPVTIESTTLFTIAGKLNLPLTLTSVVITFSLCEVLLHFKEARFILWAVYISIADVLFFVVEGRHGIFTRWIVVLGVLSTLYYIVCLFFVKAPQVSAYFKRLAIAYIILMVCTGLYNAETRMHWPYHKVTVLVYLFFELVPYIIILLTLQTMRRLESDPMTSIEKDIASIGEPIVEQ